MKIKNTTKRKIEIAIRSGEPLEFIRVILNPNKTFETHKKIYEIELEEIKS